HPLSATRLGTILYRPDGNMAAQLAKPGSHGDDQRPPANAPAYANLNFGRYAVDEQDSTIAHLVHVSLIPSWPGTTQIRWVQSRTGAHSRCPHLSGTPATAC